MFTIDEWEVTWILILFYAGNNITGTFLPLALIACMVGLLETHHIRVWRGDSLAAAAATSLIAWLLTLLTLKYFQHQIQRTTILVNNRTILGNTCDLLLDFGVVDDKLIPTKSLM